MDEHAVGVNVRGLETDRFADTESSAIAVAYRTDGLVNKARNRWIL